jgi:hypothetical protein
MLILHGHPDAEKADILDHVITISKMEEAGCDLEKLASFEDADFAHDMSGRLGHRNWRDGFRPKSMVRIPTGDLRMMRYNLISLIREGFTDPAVLVSQYMTRPDMVKKDLPTATRASLRIHALDMATNLVAEEAETE